MKKIFATIFTLIIAFALYSACSAKAEAVPAIGNQAAGTDYIEVVREKKQVFKSFDFEENLLGISTQWGNQYREISIPFSGTGSYYVQPGDVGYPQANFYIAGNSAFRTAGSYFVQFDFQATSGVYGVLSGVDLAWDSMMTEFNVDLNGGAKIVDSIGGWLSNGLSTHQNGTIADLGDGIYRCYYEFTLTGSETYSTDHAPLIWFKVRLSDAAGFVLFDNIEYGKVISGAEKLEAYWNVDCESLEVGTDPGNQQPIWGSVVDGTVMGSKSLKLTAAAGADNTQVGGFENRDGDYMYKKFIKKEGINHVEFDCLPDGLSMANIWSSGTYTAVIFNGEAWHSEGAIANFTATLNADGKSYHIAYDLPAEAYTLNFNINVSSAAGGALYIDNMVVAHPEAQPLTNQYLTIDHSVDFKQIEATGNQPWGLQPVWANTGEYAKDWWEGQTALKISGATNEYSWGVTIGGFEQRPGYDNKFIKHAGLNYIQMDIAFDGVTYLNIWTGSFYTSVEYKEGNWCSSGSVTGLKAVEIEDGYRISYFIDFPEESMNEDVKINASGESGSIYINNLLVAHEDYAPYAANATYDMINTDDIEVRVALKEQAFVSLVDAEGVAIDESLYAIDDEILILSKSLFEKQADEYAFTLVSEAGSRTFTVSKNDNRTTIEVSITDIESKEYDGTINYSGKYTLVLNGKAEGDDVVATGEIELDSANAGTANVTVKNIALSGTDAYKYVLSSDSAAGKVEITKKAITISANAAFKDKGEADPELTYTVEGILEGAEATGSLSREEGEAAGTYAILLGTLSYGDNYVITYNENDFTINETETPLDPTKTTQIPTTEVKTTEAAPTENKTTAPKTTEAANATTASKTEENPTKESGIGSLLGCKSSIALSAIGFSIISLGFIAIKKRRETE